ncbi:glutathione S-transferase family protein [Pyruvatibacter sp.]|uniref:glutathione S-transferase family protein n=1 Tax=Pyruvatibacter sp. TaxID=1981328 RepID=UPI0032F01681
MSYPWIIFALAGAVLIWFLIEKARRRTHPVSGGLQRDILLPHSAEFELYANAFSHCSRKVRLVLAECGVPYTYHQIDLIETGRYETISARYLKINPSGLVPTLVHNGHPIYESDGVLTYVAEHASADRPSLVPADLEARARMEEWVAGGVISSDDPMASMATRPGSCIPGLTLPIFVTAIRYIPLRRILVGFLFHPDKRRPAFFTASRLFGLRTMLGQKPLQQVMHQSRDHMRAHLERLSAHLRDTGGPWIMGGQYTLADVTWSCMLLRISETGWLAHFAEDKTLAPVLAYFDALQARPSWQEAITDKRHPIVEKAEADLKVAIANDTKVARALFS